MRLPSLVIALILSLAPAHAQQHPASKPATKPAIKAETPHLEFVTEYIRELSALEEIRAKGEQENTEAQGSAADTSAVFTSMIHTGTLFQLELRTDIRQLQSMRLNEPLDFLIPTITGLYADKINIWQRMIDLSAAFVGGPQPGVDYNQLAAEMPKARANLDYLDQTLFQAVPAIAEALVDLKADSQGHTSHLVITKVERQKLLDDLNIDFGSKLDEKGQNYGVSSASVLKSFLLKDFKCSDEPWE